MLVCQFRHFPGLRNQCFHQDPPLFYQRFLPEATRPKAPYKSILMVASPILSLQCNKDTLPWLIVDGTTDVAPAGGVLNQHDITEAEPAYHTITGLYLYFTLQ